MSNGKIVTLKVLVWLACLYPFASLVYRAVFTSLGPDPTHTITFWTGLATIRLLVISLAITPLRRLSPRLSWLIRFRRLLGLFAFFYASLHLLTYVGLYSYFDVRAIGADILKRRYVTAGMAAWVLLLPLALTSTKWSIRKLGKNWQKLHRLVYVAAILGVIHFWWLVKSGVRTPLTITLILGVVLLSRPLTSWLKRRPRISAPRVTTST